MMYAFVVAIGSIEHARFCFAGGPVSHVIVQAATTSHEEEV